MMKLESPLYVIQSNIKNDLYLSFTHKSYFYDKRIEVAQNKLELAFYFKSKKYAEKFLNAYFEKLGDKIKEANKRYYKVIELNVVTTNVNENIFLFGIPCYFSGEMFKAWTEAPGNYDIKL